MDIDDPMNPVDSPTPSNRCQSPTPGSSSHFIAYRNPLTKVADWTQGDVTLISEDGFYFVVEKFVLQYHSLTFQEMFRVPLSESTIKLTESSEVINTILTAMKTYRLSEICQNNTSSLTFFNHHQKVYKAAQKYQLHLLLPFFKNFFTLLVNCFGSKIAFTSFVLGCREGWEELCKVSLRYFGNIQTEIDHPKFGQPWNWTTQQMEEVGSKRFMDFLNAFSHVGVPIPGVAEGESSESRCSKLRSFKLNWNRVSEVFEFSK